MHEEFLSLPAGRPGDTRGFVHKRIFGAIGGAARGFLGGGPLGAIRGGIGGFAGTPRRPRGTGLASGQPRTGIIVPQPGLPTQGICGTPQTIALCRACGSTTAHQGGAASGGCCTPSGQRGRSNRTGYYVQTVPGSPESGGTWVAAGSRCVSGRRRNYFNGRANSHALTRLTGWARNTKRLRKAVKALEVASR